MTKTVLLTNFECVISKCAFYQKNILPSQLKDKGAIYFLKRQFLLDNILI